jgi:hypothetical protein
MPLIFEQQPREGAKAFAAFKAYLDMGAERSLEAVAQKLHKSEQLLGRWSAKLSRAFEVASKLGRLATGQSPDGENTKGDKLPALHVEVTVALEKIYGVATPPVTKEVVDVETVPQIPQKI